MVMDSDKEAEYQEEISSIGYNMNSNNTQEGNYESKIYQQGIENFPSGV